MGLDIRGCGTALVTPFRKDGSLDLDALRRLVQFQLREGIDFIVPCGTTGETPTLEHAEYLGVIRTVLQEVRGKAPVIAGVGGNNTRKVIELAAEVRRSGRPGDPFRCPLLQQTHTGRPLPALQSHRRIHRPPDHCLQRSGTYFVQYRARHGGAAFENSQHRRHQGGLRQHRATDGGSCRR